MNILSLDRPFVILIRYHRMKYLSHFCSERSRCISSYIKKSQYIFFEQNEVQLARLLHIAQLYIRRLYDSIVIVNICSWSDKYCFCSVEWNFSYCVLYVPISLPYVVLCARAFRYSSYSLIFSCYYWIWFL